LEQKEKEKKDTLEFLHLIGFDLIPQSMSDEIIARMNSQIYK
jgi:hypothetical protein